LTPAGSGGRQLSTTLALARDVAERRSGERRGGAERRTVPGAAVDVTRLEHENLFQQVGELIRMVHRVEHQLNTVMKRLDQLENRLVGSRRG
jgi:hypothetical protein